MPDRMLSFAELDHIDLGDRDLRVVELDLLVGEARLRFSSVSLLSPNGTRQVVENPRLVIGDVRGVALVPASARPEAIVLRWAFKQTSSGYEVEFLVIGDPEPVTLRFEGTRLHMEL